MILKTLYTAIPPIIWIFCVYLAFFSSLTVFAVATLDDPRVYFQTSFIIVSAIL